MASLNNITLIGRLTSDPELRYTNNGTAVCNFTLAVDRKMSKNDETDFIPVTTWTKLAEICNEHLQKGKLVSILGRLQSRKYEDKEGKNRTAFDVVAEDMQFLSPRDSGGERQPRPAAKNDGFPDGVESMMLDDQDIPF